MQPNNSTPIPTQPTPTLTPIVTPPQPPTSISIPDVPPPPIKKKKPWKLIVIIVSMVVLASVAWLIIWLTTKDKMEELSPAAVNLTEPCEYSDLWEKERDGVRQYCLSELETYSGFKEIYNEVSDALDFNQMPHEEDGTVSMSHWLEKFNLEPKGGNPDQEYLTVMTYILADYKSSMYFDHQAMFENKDEANAENYSKEQKLRETWGRFLAHEDLDYDIEINFTDHSFISNGRYKGDKLGVSDYVPITAPTTDENGKTTETPIPTQDKTTTREVEPSGDVENVWDIDPLASEEWSRNFNIEPDGNGDFSVGLKKYVAGFKMILDFKIENAIATNPYARGCAGVSEEDLINIMAVYCPAIPEKIFLNQHFIDYQKLLKSAKSINVVRHEMSHHFIHGHCDTSTPPNTRANGVNMSESVTNSYAILFMGGNREWLDSTTPANYHTNSTTDLIADNIHNNVCR